jgi:hypothetical protein
MLSRAAGDQNPEMKNKVATFSGKIAVTLGKKIGQYLKGTIDALMTNLAHQHSKVRKTTLRGLKEIMCCKGAEVFMDNLVMA